MAIPPIPAYGDMRIAACLVRPHRVELHVYDVMPTPERGGWYWYGEFDDVAAAQAAARELDPEVAVAVEV